MPKSADTDGRKDDESTMTKKEKAEELKRRIRITDLYQPKKGKGGGLVCPLCGSGEKGDGAFHIYEETNTFHCFSCGEGTSVIDLYMLLHGLDKNNKADFSKAIDELWESNGGEVILQKPEAARREVSPLTDKNKVDYTEYYEKCRERLFAEDNSGMPGLEYIEKRGLDVEVCVDHYVGFDPVADPAGKGFKTPRLIIPTTKYHYLGRAIYDDKVDKNFRVMNSANSTAGFFNIKTLRKPETQEVFVCEGAIDALSFLTVGANAIGLNSADNAKKFIKALEADRPREDILFILALDNDKDGKKWTAYLASALRALGLHFIVAANIYGKHKDANEALCADREAFISAIEKALIDTAARPDNTSSYIDDFMRADIQHFNRERKTGFQNFDNITGGLYPALYVLAAISSLGKTSFALQLADQMTAAGEDVLFFSLEMSRLELVSKSIARTAAQLHPDQFVTSTMIRKGEIPADAVAKYKETVGDRLSIIEGNFEINISSIGKYIKKYMDRTGTRPTVIIDYLQILQPAPADANKGKREGIDNTVSELKRLSRELDAPIIVISSVNRANYQAPVAFESLKESGNIEYSADVVLGLQLQCLNEPLFADEKKTVEKRERVKQEKQANPRRIELVALKNRFGVSSFSCYYKYYPSKDLFEEADEKEATQPAPFTKWTRATDKDIPA